jgi:hypothetical protein
MFVAIVVAERGRLTASVTYRLRMDIAAAEAHRRCGGEGESNYLGT